jgi:hypothetical protein
MRMYFFVPNSLSPIQKGIQAGHAALEYARLYGDTIEYINFIRWHKTWIILNGGTTMDVDKNGNAGDLNLIAGSLYNEKVNFAFFREPDLNNAVTAVCFLANEFVYNRELFPDLPTEYSYPEYMKWVESLNGIQNVFLRKLITGKSLA